MSVPPGLVAGLFAVLALGLLALRRPLLAALGVRQGVQRPRQMALIAFGLMVATAVITGATVGGDSMQGSMRSAGLDYLGGTDITVTGSRPFDHATATRLLAVPVVEVGTAASAVAYVVHASIANEETDLGEPEIHVWGVDPAEQRALDALAPRAGAVPATMAAWPAHGIVLNERLADRLDAAVGHDVTLYADAERGPPVEQTYRVLAVVANRGSDPVEPGLTAFLPRDGLQTLLGAQGRVTTLLVRGAEGADLTTMAMALGAEARAVAAENPAAPRFEVRNVRAEVVQSIDEESEGMSVFFLVLGSFSILAGILLIVSLLAMLIEERKADLATLRAVGARRFDLTQIHMHEAALYATAASLLGLAAGIGFAAFIIHQFRSLVPVDTDAFRLHVEPVTLLASAGAGFALTILVVVLAAQRIARFNVAHGLRGEDAPARGHGWRSLLAYVALLAGGAALTVLALREGEVVPGVAGPSLLALGLGGLLVRRIRREVVFPLVGLALLAYLAWSFTHFTDLEGDQDFQVMPLRGALLTVAATLLVVYMEAPARLAAWLAARVRRLDAVADAAFAYAHARRTRTALTVSMMALVLVILVTTSTVFAMWQPVGEELVGGFDVRGTSRSALGDPAAWLAAHPPRDGADPLAEVAALHALPFLPSMRGATMDNASLSDWNEEMGVAGITEPFAAAQRFSVPGLAPAYADGTAALRAAAADDSLAVASQWLWFNTPGGGRAPLVGDVISLRLAEGPHNVTVIALVESGFAGGLMVSPGLVTGQPAAGTLLFAAVRPGADAEAVSRDLEAAFRAAGMDAQTQAELVAGESQWVDTFLAIIQVYVGMGFVIGVASIGIVAARNVIERRREIGVLRALGATHGQVGSLFVLEALFVVTLASVVGLGAGLLTAYASYLAEFKDQGAVFTADWANLGVIFAVAYATALVATWLPARRASRIPPALATRHTE